MIGRFIRKTVAVLVTALIAVIAAYIVLTSLFPVKYENEIKSACDEFDIPCSLVLAAIKAESNFDEKAMSVKGAKGLMQLTDSTAAWCAEKIGLGEYNISEPEDNIRLGTYYLSYLTKMYNGNKKLAIASYNAGYGNVNKWLNNDIYSSNGELLKIPYKETENYVKKVQLYERIYESVIKRNKLFS